ncbi:MAG: transglutaminase domain-containing protein [Oscillospiraceae bacterium]|nr:transglutaminase domain-containing protein [Oscillospiraceae bacterium]
MKKSIAALALTMAMLVGCGSNLPGTGSVFTSRAPAPTAETEEAPTFQAPLMALSPTPQYWARQQLTAAEQETYDKLSAAVASHLDSEVQVDVDADQVSRVLTALRIDHPEYFWFEGEASFVTTTDIFGTTTGCTMKYTMELEEAQKLLPQVENYAAQCLSSPRLAAASGDYDKIIAVYQYIIENTDYVLSEPDQSFITLMTQGRGTCAGYARAFQYLMYRLGIPCVLALGEDSAGESHGWNIVQCGGKWYHIDVTWGDPVDENGQPGNSLQYTYCMITDEEIYRTHRLKSEIPVPTCTDLEYNYYRQSGLQMESWDPVRFEARLETAAEQGDHWLQVRFSSQEAYDAAINALITQSGILTVLQNAGIPIPEDGVVYTRNDDFFEFSVLLAY